MGRKNLDGIFCFLAVLTVMVLLHPNNIVYAQRYTCWGGCYNECFLRTNSPDRFGCYYPCLNNCRSPSDYQYYCQVRCSTRLCDRDTPDGAQLEKCFDQCKDFCSR